jgi:hypothetical protein
MCDRPGAGTSRLELRADGPAVSRAMGASSRSTRSSSHSAYLALMYTAARGLPWASTTGVDTAISPIRNSWTEMQ